MVFLRAKDIQLNEQQIAANHKGSQLLHSLVDEHGLKVVHGYMGFIQK